MSAAPCPGCGIPTLRPLPACRDCRNRLPHPLRIAAETTETGARQAAVWLADHPVPRWSR